MFRTLITKRGAAALALVLLVALVCATGADAALPSGRYVALGDSFAAGAGAGSAVAGAPVDCAQTAGAYPYLTGTSLGLTVDNQACSGATINHGMLKDQKLQPSGYNDPPQLLTLGPDVSVVTISVGGNDAGFSSVVANCLDDPQSTLPCNGAFGTTTGAASAQLGAMASFGDSLGEVIDAVRAFSPSARTFVVGYLPALPAGGTCNGISSQDAQLYSGWLAGVAASQSAAATAHGATFIDPSLAGHEICSGAQSWLLPSGDPDEYQPNAAGQKAIAAAVDTAVRAAFADPVGTVTGSSATKLAPKLKAKKFAASAAAAAPVALKKPRSGGLQLTLKLPQALKLRFQFVHTVTGRTRNYSRAVVLSLKSGSNKLYLTGRDGGKIFAPGSYKLRISGGGVTTWTSATLRVAAAKKN